MTTNLFLIVNVKQLRTGGSFRILLPFIRTSWGVRFLNSAIFNTFHNRVKFDTILKGLQNFGAGGGGVEPPHPPRYATDQVCITYQLHVSANAAVAIIRLDTIYQRSCIAMTEHNNY